MSTITKQWLQQKIADMEATRDEIPFGLDEDDRNTLAALRIALASLEAEPVAWLLSGGGAKNNVSFDSGNAYADPLREVTPLYTAPPAPVSVPDYPETLPCPVMLEPGLRFGKGVTTKTMLGALQRRAEHYAELEAMTPEQRAEHDAGMKELAAMLQGADGNFPAHSGCRPAQNCIPPAQCGNSPVIPDGWVLVPVEPTPEMQTAAAGAIRFDTTPINKLWTGNAVYKAMIAAAPQQEVR